MPPPSDQPAEDDFFVGYLATPPRVKKFLWRIVPVILLIVLIVAGLIAARQRDPGNGEWDAEIHQFEGTLITRPYPILQSRDGRSFLLVGEGKHAVDLPASASDGAAVRAQGTIIQRGSLRLFEATSVAVIAPGSSRGEMPKLSVETRLFRGEIVDPKCFGGGMKPGDGKTHKACAALCLRGGIPPAFVSDSGEMFVLIGVPVDQLIPVVGERVELRGTPAQIGSIPFLEVTEAPHIASK